jgi:hypothetical protein
MPARRQIPFRVCHQHDPKAFLRTFSKSHNLHIKSWVHVCRGRILYLIAPHRQHILMKPDFFGYRRLYGLLAWESGSSVGPHQIVEGKTSGNVVKIGDQRLGQLEVLCAGPRTVLSNTKEVVMWCVLTPPTTCLPLTIHEI